MRLDIYVNGDRTEARPGPWACACMGLKYHVRIVGGAIVKALRPEARSPSLLASRIYICTTYGLLSIWLLR